MLHRLDFKTHSIILLTAFMLALCTGAFADAGKTSACFLKMDVGARVKAMGGAGAVLNDDVTSLFSNPAGLGGMEKRELFAAWHQIYQGIEQGYLGWGAGINKQWKYGLGLGRLFVGGIKKSSSKEYRDEGYTEALDLSIIGGLAHQITPKLCAGISGKFIQEELDTNKASAAALDIGGIYQGTNYSCGLAVQNIGQKLKFIEQAESLPLTLRLGIRYNLWKNRVSIAGELEQLIKDKNSYCHLGLEYWLMDSLALRAGCQISDLGRYSAGLGYKKSNLVLDYAFLPFDKLGDTHQVSLRMPFDIHKQVKGAELEIEEIHLEDIFPSKRSYYAENSMGRIRLRNNSGKAITQIQISLDFSGELVKYPGPYQVEDISPYSTREIPLSVSFDDKLCVKDEDTHIQAQIKIAYTIGDMVKEPICRLVPLMLFKQEAIDWRNPKSIGGFVTPNDTPVKLLTRQAISSLQDIQIPGILYPMAVFEMLSDYSFKYLDDKRHKYKDMILDDIQYPRATLQLRTGDCDDYTILYASCLRSIGKKVVLITVPGHIFLAFDTGVAVKNADLVSLDENSYIVKDGLVFLPLELTRLQKNGFFFDAWKDGARKYQEWKDSEELEIIDLEEAEKLYPPIPLPPVDMNIEKPSAERINLRTRQNIEKIKAYNQNALHDIIKKYQACLESNPHDQSALNQLGIVYAKAGSFEDAEKLLSQVNNPVVQDNNLGNVYLLKGKYDDALKFYKKARAAAPADVDVCLNLGICYCLQDRMEVAEKLFKEAIGLSPDCQRIYSLLGIDMETAETRDMDAEDIQSKIRQLLLKLARMLDPEKKIGTMGAKEIRGEDTQKAVRLTDEELVQGLCCWKMVE